MNDYVAASAQSQQRCELAGGTDPACAFLFPWASSITSNLPAPNASSHPLCLS